MKSLVLTISTLVASGGRSGAGVPPASIPSFVVVSSPDAHGLAAKIKSTSDLRRSRELLEKLASLASDTPIEGVQELAVSAIMEDVLRTDDLSYTGDAIEAVAAIAARSRSARVKGLAIALMFRELTNHDDLDYAELVQEKIDGIAGSAGGREQIPLTRLPDPPFDQGPREQPPSRSEWYARKLRKAGPAAPGVSLDYPAQAEIISGPHYTLRFGAAADMNDVEISIDGGAWRACRKTGGHFWFDWSGYRSGEHEIMIRARPARGGIKHFGPRLLRVARAVP